MAFFTEPTGNTTPAPQDPTAESPESPDRTPRHDRRLPVFHFHATLAHFPVALVAASLIFYVLGAAGLEQDLGPTSRMCLLLAIVCIPLTALTGIGSWQLRRSGAAPGVFHAKLVAAALLLMAAILTLGPELRQATNRLSYGAGLVICLWLVGLLAHLGGVIVFRRIGLEDEVPPPRAPDGRPGPDPE
jgi:uncharacterized membrane protein